MKYRYQSQGKVYEIVLEKEAGGYRAVVDGQPYPFTILDDRPGALTLNLSGQVSTVFWTGEDSAGRRWLSLDGCSYQIEKPLLGRGRQAEAGAQNQLRAPMPAQVRLVQVEPGAAVEKGQTLLVLEAMKMEMRLQAPRPGRVARLHVAAGQQVERDQLLLELEDE